MLISTQSFFEPLEAWIRAIRAEDFPAARRHAEHLVEAGELLVVHPDFRRCFRQHCGETDPHQTLVHLCRFLVCATDGRANVMRQKARRPADPQ